MYNINHDYLKQRIVDLQQEARQNELGHHFLSRIKKSQKPFFEKSLVLFYTRKYKLTFKIGIDKLT
ncbi:hypothetical protein [Sporosarcina sp. FSL K6-2383]|uniref:hypothetical protein n=1 Tax=Sporosarcina sp. FSL K6-2383 TaxID=2921556 RepID=UPI00315A3581